MTLSHISQPGPGYEPIEGYVLEALIGRGGFGEVWRAIAPGGLSKAVKIVPGIQDRRHGSRELRSLERMKSVRHPFLLALERFGIVDDRLVIVTELADGSLEDLFRRHRERGSCGIPRETLLRFLHDAADALDYLHEEYQLQHLDVKPGNLLLVGGHVKVGDFGLLKDLREVECSVVSGLTPIYAPPELFDGQPSLHSDQYSLAVMYQEVLTGTRPFGGRTIAQLATQHIHNTPNLLPLPPSDRPVVARALEKTPDRRYPSCKAFVHALRAPQRRGGGAIATIAPPGSGDGSSGSATNRPVVAELPQIQLAADADREAQGRGGRVLILGLGGTGGRCIRELRRRASAVRSLDLHTLLIDTDADSIRQAESAASDGDVRTGRSLHIPLRSAQEYRNDRRERLQSVSRRWIYNVPRSRATEGVRPLGRLAMVDAGPLVPAVLAESVTDLIAAGDDAGPVRVYVVGSLAGGTGSGIYIDLVHLLRDALDDARMADVDVISLLAGPPLRGNPAHPLQLHDTRAALQELRHFAQPGHSYPGDPGAGWPGVPAARSPLRDVYLITEGPSGITHPPPIASIVEYLWADATGASDLLAASRSGWPRGEPQNRVPAIRSFGAVPLRSARVLEKNLLAPAVVRHLLIDWLGRPREAQGVAPVMAERMAKRCRLDVHSVIESVLKIFGADPARRMRELRRITEALPEDVADEPNLAKASFRAALEARAGVTSKDVVVNPIVLQLIRELAVRLQDRRADLTSAIQAVEILAERCRDSGRQLAEGDPEPLSPPEPDLSKDIAGDIFSLPWRSAPCWLHQFAVGSAAERFRALAGELDGIVRQLQRMAVRTARGIQQLSEGKRAEENPWDDMATELRCEFEPILLRLHGQASTNWLSGPLGGPSCPTDPAEMLETLGRVALEQVIEAVDRSAGGGALADRDAGDTTTAVPAVPGIAIRPTMTRRTQVLRQETGGHRDTLALNQGPPSGRHQARGEKSLEDALAQVRPPLLDCGGRQRLLLIVGSDSERDELEPRLRAIHPGSLQVTVVHGATPLLVHEAQGIAVDDVLARLDALTGGPQVSQRLHSRTDVDWSR